MPITPLFPAEKRQADERRHDEILHDTALMPYKEKFAL